ncbi:MAG: glycosyltransferase [Methanomicrobiales archaeon]|nr:glycosyltransferase [Methanomicrobiales archaeon]
MKFTLISSALPPSASGQAIVLYNLLKDYPAEKYSLITQRDYYHYRYTPRITEYLPAKYHFLQPEQQMIRCIISASGRVGASSLVLSTFLALRKKQIKSIIKKESSERVVVCTADLFNLPAVHLSCTELKVPYFVYMFDHYSNQWIQPQLKIFAQRYEQQILEAAAGVIFPNEFLANFYKKFKVNDIVLHNPCDLSRYARSGFSKSALSNGKMILYTGHIYEAHYAAFRNLIEAIRLLKREDITLQIYTVQRMSHLQKEGIKGPHVAINPPISDHLIPQIQAEADILFLPLSMNSSYGKEVINTSAPGKMGEYLASGTPILVHAPKDSFVSWYFRTYNCGLVVDEENPKSLADGIVTLLEDDSIRNKFQNNALERARIDFDLEKIKKHFFGLIADNGDIPKL